MEQDWVILNIDEHRMWVSLAIKEPEGDECHFFSADFIEQYLKGHGITAGIDHIAIQSLSESVAYGTEIIVARGKEAVKGQDGCYNFTVVMEDAKAKPTVNRDGSVDYYNSLKLAMVKEGEVFAVYEPATPGEYGYTVFSEMIPPVKGREARPLRGKGFKVSEDGREYSALYDGRIVRENERIIIEKLYYVKGDLDIEQGNIKFNGDVEIKGDVRSGLSIETEGSIFIHGHVGASTLIAGKNITINKGVQGRDKCFIHAGGDVACSFVERCIINADGNVYANSIMDSDIYARKKVIVSSKRGVIIGGKVTGIQGVSAKEAGNDAGIETVIRVRMVEGFLKKILSLKEQMAKVTSELELLEKNHRIYESLEGNKSTKETEAMRMKIIRAKVIKTTEKKQISDEIVTLSEEIEASKKDAVIEITGVCHAGVNIVIGNNEYIEREDCKDVIYKFSGVEIKRVAGDR